MSSLGETKAQWLGIGMCESCVHSEEFTVIHIVNWSCKKVSDNSTSKLIAVRALIMW